MAMACALAALHPVFLAAMAPRTLALQARAADAPAAWSFEFAPPRGHAPNGWWIDVAASPSGEASNVAVEAIIPPNEPREATLRWHGPRGQLTVSSVLIRTHVFKHEFRPEQALAAAMELPATAEPGSTVLVIPPRPWYLGWPLRLSLAAAIFFLVWVLLEAVFTVARRCEGRSSGIAAPDPGSAGRGPLTLRVVTVVVVIAGPAWAAWWSPMIAGGDSGDYASFAARFPRESLLQLYNGYRLPGYSLLIAPFMHGMQRFEVGVGLAQAAIGVFTSLLVWSFVARRARAPWPHVAAMLVAIDPISLCWQRILLTENLAMFFAVAIAWMLDRALATRSAPKAVLWAACTGLLGGCASWVRGNFQLTPIISAGGLMAAGFVGDRRLRGVVAAGLCLAAAGAILAPAIAQNKRKMDVPSFIVGTKCNRIVFAWLNECAEWNQTGAFTFEQFRAVRARVQSGLGEWGFCDLLETTSAMPTPYTYPWAQREHRAGIVAAESLRRRPGEFVSRAAESTLVQLGVPLRTRSYYLDSSEGLLAPMRGRLTPAMAASWRAWSTQRAAPIDRVLRESADRGEALRGSANARAYDVLYVVFQYGRPVLLLLLPLAGARMFARSDYAGVTIVAMIVGNALAVAVLSGGGEARYGMPLWPLMTACVFAGLFPRRGSQDEQVAVNRVDPL